MDNELLIIELLSTKQKIMTIIKKQTKKMSVMLGFYFIGALFFFYGLARVVYQYLLNRGISYSSIDRVTNLYGFSKACGFFVMVILFLLFSFLWGRYHHISRHFDQWIEKRVENHFYAKAPIQDFPSIFLFEKNELKMTVAKKDCFFLSKTIDDVSLFLGIYKWHGMDRYAIFIETDETMETVPEIRTVFSRHFALGAGLLLLGLGGAFFYASGGPISGIHGSTIAKGAVTHSSERSDDGNLLKDPKKEVQLVASQTNDLKIDQETKKLYMTTDQGKQWRFVPLELDWVRFGDYTLTSGTIPVGYWMDKTFDLSPDFSWFLYSPDQQDVYMLTSTDAGKTWGKNLITNHGERVRYRKATFLNGDQGIVMLSTDNGMSAESLQIYTTNDKGKSWISTGGTVIDQPIQNVSFVTTSLGFVSTREKLYYTANGGRSFKESIVTIPADYQTGGLDLFQSPNEVTQVSANKLEAKFYLLKANSIDIGKMFACLFTSTDNGETWQFEQQLSQVDIND